MMDALPESTLQHVADVGIGGYGEELHASATRIRHIASHLSDGALRTAGEEMADSMAVVARSYSRPPNDHNEAQVARVSTASDALVNACDAI
jgi:hypothetical protein